MIRRRNVCSAIAALGLGKAAAATPPMPGRSAAVQPTYFGMHFHRLVADAPGSVPTLWPDGVTIGALRLWDSGHRWADLAPAPGRWEFARMDAYVDLAVAHGAQVSYTLGSPPRWASARPDEPGPYGAGCAAEPRRMSDWIDYVRRVVTRYRGRIHAYELWNEPNFSDVPRDRGQPAFYSGSVATMVQMGRCVRAIIDELDPTAQLFTPGFVNGPDRLGLFLQAGGAGLVDGIAYHFYSDSSRRFSEQVGQVRTLMRQHGVSALPLWNTETGVEAGGDPKATDTPQQRLAGAQLAQYLLLGAAEGIARFYDYAWDNTLTGMVDARGRDLPRRAAFSQVQSWMLGAAVSPPQPMADSSVRVWASRGAERFAFLWADHECALVQAVPTGWRLAAVERLFETPLPVSGAMPSSIGPEPLRLRFIRSGRGAVT